MFSEVFDRTVDPPSPRLWDHGSRAISMRDNHQSHPELVSTHERDGLYFGVICLSLPSDSGAFEFGVDVKGHQALKRILQTRPFDQMPGVSCKYFFTGSYSRKLKDGLVTVVVRVEQGASAKNFHFDCPDSLASNLVWFFSLKDFKELAALKRINT
jgi:hypothetical protein